MDCLFCKICDHRIPAHIIHEDEETVAFLDIHPIAAGHTVLVSKVHAPTITELPEEHLPPLCLAVQKVTQQIDKALSPDGFNIGWNHGEAGGQTIAHLHIHIIPRWKGDGGGSMHSIVKNPPKEDLERVKQSIINNAN